MNYLHGDLCVTAGSVLAFFFMHIQVCVQLPRRSVCGFHGYGLVRLPYQRLPLLLVTHLFHASDACEERGTVTPRCPRRAPPVPFCDTYLYSQSSFRWRIETFSRSDIIYLGSPFPRPSVYSAAGFLFCNFCFLFFRFFEGDFILFVWVCCHSNEYNMCLKQSIYVVAAPV